MQMIGPARLGRTTEARAVGDNVVANLSLAFDYYDPKSQNQNKQSTTWIDAALWGKLATSLEPYLVKGTWVSCTIDDIHLETYQGRNGEGTKLVGRITKIKLIGGKQEGEQQGQQQRPQQQSRPAQQSAAQRPASGAEASRPPIDDMDDDIPF